MGGNEQVRGVFARVERDKQVAQLLYGLLGWEDERDPQAAIASLAARARLLLRAGGPAYRQRVFAALRLMDGLILDVAEDAVPDRAVPARAEDRVAAFGGVVVAGPLPPVGG